MNGLGGVPRTNSILAPPLGLLCDFRPIPPLRRLGFRICEVRLTQSKLTQWVGQHGSNREVAGVSFERAPLGDSFLSLRSETTAWVRRVWGWESSPGVLRTTQELSVSSQNLPSPVVPGKKMLYSPSFPPSQVSKECSCTPRLQGRMTWRRAVSQGSVQCVGIIRVL